MCNMPIGVATKVFEMLNHGKVRIISPGVHCSRYLIITDVEPKNLVYPEGWYYAKGSFRNKHTSTNGMYEEAMMLTSDRQYWKNRATYCTL